MKLITKAPTKLNMDVEIELHMKCLKSLFIPGVFKCSCVKGQFISYILKIIKTKISRS